MKVYGHIVSAVPLFAGMSMEEGYEETEQMNPAFLDNDHHEYIRERCVKPLNTLKTL